jgi:transposase
VGDDQDAYGPGDREASVRRQGLHRHPPTLGRLERSFAWIMKSRRLVRDYEQLTRTAEALILIAASAIMLRRWT